MDFLANRGIQFIVQSTIHAWIITLVLEALIRIWEIHLPQTRIQFRLAALMLPLVGWPLFQFLHPERGGQHFRETVAIIDLNAWLSLKLWDVPLFYLLAGVLVLNALVFLGQELIPALRLLLGSNKYKALLQPPTERLQRALTAVLRGIEARDVQARLLEQNELIASALGLRTHRLVLSASVVDILDDDELKAVLAHELAHHARKDNFMGWMTLLIAALMLYNPFALLALRLMAQEREKACDDFAAQRTGRPLALASALVKVARSGPSGRPAGPQRPPYLGPGVWLHNLEHRARRVQVERRIARLIRPSPDIHRRRGGVGIAVGSALLALLLFFVV